MSIPARPPSSHAIVVAGFGSEYRHDDGVGIVVAEQVAALLGESLDVGPVVDPLDLLGRWDDADLAIVVDALRSGSDPGTLRVIDLAPTELDPAGSEAAGARAEHGALGGVGAHMAGAPSATSSHGIGLTGVLRLARAVGHAPGRVVVIGVEGDDFTQGPGLSPSVARAVPEAVRTVVRLIAENRRCA